MIFLNNKTKNGLALAILLLCLLIYYFQIFESICGWSRSSVQYVLSLPLLIAFALFSVSGFRFPRSVIILAVCVTTILGFAFVRFSRGAVQDVSVFLSPFLKDDNQAQTIKFQDLLSKDFTKQKLNLKIDSLPNPVQNYIEANAVFSRQSSDSSIPSTLIIAGSLRWLEVYFPQISQRALGVAAPVSPMAKISSIEEDYSLDIVDWVSKLGLSEANSQATRDYLTLLIKAYKDLIDGNFAEAELDLYDASSVIGRWTSAEHRAYSLWLLGTVYLHKSLSGDKLDKAYLSCALDMLGRARKFIQNKNNPELLAAILNNRGVAHFFAYLFWGKKEHKQQALREFNVAAKLLPRSAKRRVAAGFNKNMSFNSWAISKANLWSLRKQKQQKKSAKKKKKNKV